MASRYFSQFKEKKVSASGARPGLSRPGTPGAAGPTWQAGGPSSAPTWAPGDRGVGGWPKEFYPGPHPGVENEMHGKHSKRMRQAMEHADEPGAGAKARRKAGLRGQEKVHTVMSEFKRGTLRSGGSGKKVKNRKQAVAIAMSEAGLSRKKK